MLEHLLWFVFGLGLLLAGADSFLKGATALALRFGIPPFIVGLTIVGIGTSAPELAVNLSAAWRGSYQLALGNVVGSNIANIGLILGMSALFAPLAVHMRLLRVEVPLMAAASLLLLLLCLDGEIGRIDAMLLLAGLLALLTYVVRNARSEPADVKDELGDLAVASRGLAGAGLRLALGLVLLVYGASCMVDSAVALARIWGWSELVIGLTVVAIGTSLPELVSSLLAVHRGQADIAVGNVVGSNLFNILLILGGTAALHPLPVADATLRFELPVMLAFAIAGWMVMLRRRVITRGEGALLLMGFVAFTGLQLSLAMT